jgi:uncharacterized protein
VETKENLIKLTELFVNQELCIAEPGHDYWHAVRVRNNALTIAKSERCDALVIELSALLHDIADSKFNNGDENAGPEKAAKFLSEQGVNSNISNHIIQIIRNISFKGGTQKRNFNSLELDIVQDADRLDAIGAIGIARAFSYGGHKGREFYNPEISPIIEMTAEQYKNSTAPTINHFYEKLILLKEKMNTSKGRELAEKRHEYLLKFMDQFYKEWYGDDNLQINFYPW